MPFSQKNNAIEFYRFIFAVIIYLLHAKTVLSVNIFPFGYLSVEFFFILSGFLLAKHNTISSLNSERKILQYFYTKLKKIFPLHAFAWILMAIISIKLYDVSVIPIITTGLTEFFLLEGFGFPKTLVNGVAWYLSAYFAGLYIIVHCQLYIKKELLLYFIAPLTILMGYGYIIKNFNHLNVVAGYFLLLRGVSGLMLGYLSFFIFQNIKETKTTKKYYLCTIIEIVCGGLLLINCMGIYVNFMLFPFISALLIVSTFTENSIFAKYLNNKIIAFLGKISLAFYLNQNIVKHLFNIFVFQNYTVALYLKIILLIGFNVIFSIFSIWLIDSYIKKFRPFRR